LAKYAGLAGVVVLIVGWRALRPRQPAPGAAPKVA
jgi:hypothetical protein